MTPAKKAYYEFKNETDKYHEGLVDPINDYVCELEEQKADMLELLIDMMHDNFIMPPENRRFLLDRHKAIIEAATGKTIEEVLAK